jgi:hypothetical protein
MAPEVRMKERACVTCGVSFTASHPARNTCSDPCDQQKRRATTARYRQRVRERPKHLPAEQVCSRCGRCLPAAAFDLNRARASGLQNYCKGCRAEYAGRPDQREKDRLRKHVWYLLNYDRQRQRFRERFSNDPAFRWQVLQSNRRRYHANPKRHYARQRELRHARNLWEAEDRRRCFCGRALPGDGERWFCRPQCKVHCARFVCGLRP